jgi:hypothetical protein
MVLVDNQNWINELGYWGETVTVRSVTDDSYSKWGDSTESTSDTASVKAMVVDISDEQLKETEGEFTPGDKIFFFKSDESNISVGNRIIHNSITYEILRAMIRELGGKDFFQEAWGKKV